MLYWELQENNVKGNKNMNIRKAALSELDNILCIYAYAREQMKKNGNPGQWGDDKPDRQTIVRDIRNGYCHVIEHEGNICGVFAFLSGEEPTYRVIEGKWTNDSPYGTIHRVASDGSVRGILKECLDFCERQFRNIRIDTHEDNKIMQKLLEKYGYIKCGIIHVEDGTPRIAYQKSAAEAADAL